MGRGHRPLAAAHPACRRGASVLRPGTGTAGCTASPAGCGRASGRSRNPVIKVEDLAWLEFEEAGPGARGAVPWGLGWLWPTRDAGLFGPARAVGLGALRDRAPWRKSRFVGPTFLAATREDLDRLARATGGTVSRHREGQAVQLTDPSGFAVRVVHGAPQLPALPEREPLALNFGSRPVRANATQRPVRWAAQVQRSGACGVGDDAVPGCSGLVPGTISA